MDTKQLSMLFLAGLAMSLNQASGEPFAFQGQLNNAGSPANGIFDLEFMLYSVDIGGTQIGQTITIEDQVVTNGVFAVDLDFGDAFDGTERWIEMSVRDGDSMDVFTELTPRLKVGRSPQASYASKSGQAESLTNQFWTQAPGILFFGEDEGSEQFFINRDRDIVSTDVMVVHSAKPGLGGFTLSSWANGMPYFGYATGGFLRAMSYYDPVTDAWVVNKGGDQLEIDSNNDVIITNNLVVGGTITSLSEPMATSDFKSYTPETIFAGFGTTLVFNSLAGAIVNAGSGSYLRADFDFPHGSVIKSIRIEYRDAANPNNLSIQLWQRDLVTLNFSSTVLAQTSGSDPNNVRVLTIVPDPDLVIDNTSFTYDLRIFASNGSWPSAGQMGVRNILVEYDRP